MSIRKRFWTDAGGKRHEAWQVSHTDEKGKRRRQQFPTKKQADAYLAKVAREKHDRSYCHAAGEALFGDVLTKYLEDCERRVRLDELAPSTAYGYRLCAETHLRSEFGKLKLNEITSPLVRAWRNAKLEAEFAPSYVKGLVMLVNLTLAFAQQEELIIRNVLVDNPVVVKIRDDETSDYIPTLADIRTLLDALEHRGCHEHEQGFRLRKALIPTALFTAMRRGELLGLHWSDVYFDQSRILVRQQLDYHTPGDGLRDTKTRKERWIPLIPRHAEILREYRAYCNGRPANGGGDLVFQTRNGTALIPQEISNPEGYFPNLMRKAGLAKPDGTPKFRFHDLRHVAASLMLRGGIPLKQVQSITGPMRAETLLNVYAHLFADDDSILPELTRIWAPFVAPTEEYPGAVAAQSMPPPPSLSPPRAARTRLRLHERRAQKRARWHKSGT